MCTKTKCVQKSNFLVCIFFKICNKFALLNFPRLCNNILKVWWKILHSFVGNIHPLFSSERIKPPNPQFGAKFRTYLKCELRYCDFCVEIFVTMATGVGLTQISLMQLNWQTSKNPYLVQESWWYLKNKLIYSQFSDEIYQFLVTMATMMDLAKIWMTPFDWRTPKPPVWCKTQDLS